MSINNTMFHQPIPHQTILHLPTLIPRPYRFCPHPYSTPPLDHCTALSSKPLESKVKAKRVAWISSRIPVGFVSEFCLGIALKIISVVFHLSRSLQLLEFIYLNTRLCGSLFVSWSLKFQSGNEYIAVVAMYRVASIVESLFFKRDVY